MDKKQNHKNNPLAFTLLEVMIAISIFGFLMVYVAQFTRSEIQVFESVSRQNNVEQKARSAMMHILDEIRLNQFVGIVPAPSETKGIYRYTDYLKTVPSKCLIDMTPRSDLSNPLLAEIFYLNDPSNNRFELWYRSPDLGNQQYRIADEIMELSFTPDTFDPTHLIEIHIKAGDTSKKSQPFELRTWIRVY